MRSASDLAAYVDSHPVAPERALWLAVIAQAITDATPTLWKSRKTAEPASEKIARKKAISFLESAYFDTVCDHAGVDPDWMRARLPEAIRNRKSEKAARTGRCGIAA